MPSSYLALLDALPGIVRKNDHKEHLALQETLRAVLPANHRARMCLHHRISRTGVTVGVTTEGTTRLGGLVVCGNGHVCPVCHARKMSEERELVTGKLLDFVAEGGFVISTTLTLPHHPSERLQLLLDALKAMWKSFTNGRIWQSLCESLGIVGWIKRIEVLYGAHGWHPHLHVAFMSYPSEGEDLRNTATRQQFLDAAFASISAAWIEAGEQVGRRVVAGGVEVGIISDEGDAKRFAQYATKNMGYSGGDGLSATPIDLLRIAGQSGDKTAVATAVLRFREWSIASKGMHTVSSGGKARLPRKPKKAPTKPAEQLGTITPEGWTAVLTAGKRKAVANVKTQIELIELMEWVASAAKTARAVDDFLRIKFKSVSSAPRAREHGGREVHCPDESNPVWRWCSGTTVGPQPFRKDGRCSRVSAMAPRGDFRVG